MKSHPQWILTGSFVGLGDIFILEFDLIVFLWLPSDIRIQRLHERERMRYGHEIGFGVKMHENYIKFINWASMYDSEDESIRSKWLHELWLKDIKCDVLRLEGKFNLERKVKQVITRIKR